MEFYECTYAKYALVRPVPAFFNRCIRTNLEEIDVSLARRQHEEYCRSLQNLGLELIWIEGDDALPDARAKKSLNRCLFKL